MRCCTAVLGMTIPQGGYSLDGGLVTDRVSTRIAPARADVVPATVHLWYSLTGIAFTVRERPAYHSGNSDGPPVVRQAVLRSPGILSVWIAARLSFAGVDGGKTIIALALTD